MEPDRLRLPLTRRARGLPLWFSMAVYGLDAYRDAIEAAVQLARDTALDDRSRLMAATALRDVNPRRAVKLYRQLATDKSINALSRLDNLAALDPAGPSEAGRDAGSGS